MRTESKAFKYLLWKAYFDKGLSLTNYMKYVIALFGFFSFASSSLTPKIVVVFGLCYLLFCIVLGKLWYVYKMVEVENEITNHYNPFQREVRAKLKHLSKS